MRRNIIIFSLIIFLFFPAMGKEIILFSWNWEHFGSPGRGFPSLELSARNNGQLKKMGALINERDVTLICLQEIAVDSIETPFTNYQLDKMSQLLGRDWKYRIAAPAFPEFFEAESPHNLQNAFLWNSKKVTLEKSFTLDFPSIDASGKSLFSRKPLCGYFITPEGNDFLIVNLHLASGQQYDENHLAALILIEQNISAALKENGIKESDRLILGDFNDSCGRTDEKSSRLIPDYFQARNYFLLSRDLEGITRIGDNGGSFIDQILANRSMMKHITGKTELLTAADFGMTVGRFREDISDHYPLAIRIIISKDDDAD